MFGEKAYELIKELHRSTDNMPLFNDELFRQVLDETNAIFEQNHRDALSCSSSGDRRLVPLVSFRHASLQRNKRCILAYLYNRLQRIKEMRWQFGPTLPSDIKTTLCDPEVQWFNEYSKNLATYMRSIGDGIGINLTEGLKPPKSLYIEVRCLTDYGKYELENGDIILLKKNSQHFLPRAESEQLIRQGILQHIT